MIYVPVVVFLWPYIIVGVTAAAVVVVEVVVVGRVEVVAGVVLVVRPSASTMAYAEVTDSQRAWRAWRDASTGIGGGGGGKGGLVGVAWRQVTR